MKTFLLVVNAASMLSGSEDLSVDLWLRYADTESVVLLTVIYILGWFINAIFAFARKGLIRTLRRIVLIVGVIGSTSIGVRFTSSQPENEKSPVENPDAENSEPTLTRGGVPDSLFVVTDSSVNRVDLGLLRESELCSVTKGASARWIMK